MEQHCHIRCAQCGAEWSCSAAGGADVGEASVLLACAECGTIAGAVAKLTADELKRYRRDLLKAVQKIHQGYFKGRSRIESRVRALAHDVAHGQTERVEALRATEARLAAIRPPDTALLEARAKEVERVEAAAPRSRPEIACEVCGAAATVYRESHRGYEIPCPRCRAKLVVKCSASS